MYIVFLLQMLVIGGFGFNCWNYGKNKNPHSVVGIMVSVMVISYILITMLVRIYGYY